MADIYFDVDTALAEVPVNIFPLTDDTDFKTRETSVAYNATGMDLVWNFVTTGGAMSQTAVTPTTGGAYDWAHQGDGMYTIEIPASGGASINNDTEGFGWFTGMATGVLPWRSPVFGFRAAGINDKLIDSAYDTTRGLAGTALPAAAADAAGGLPISDAGGLDIDAQLATLTNGTYGLSAIENLVDDIESRLTATRAGYLDNLSGGAVALASVCTDARLAELGAANIPADIDTLISRLTALRAGYLDNLSAGAVALASGVTVTTNNDKTGYTVSTVSDKTGYALSEAGVTAVQSGLSTLTAQQVWEYTTRTLSSFGSLVADVATAVWGAVARTITGGTVTTNNDKTGYTLTVTPPTAVQVRAEIDSNSTQLAAIVADTAEIQVELADGGRTDLLIDGIKTATDNLATAMTADGAVYKFTANALEEAPGGGTGGDATLTKQEEILTAVAGVITHGDSNWLTPSGIGGTIVVTFNVKDDSGNNILDAVVEVWDTAGTTLKERKETNSSGNAVFNCKAEVYTIKITKAGYTFSDAAYTVTVPATVNYVMTAFVIAAPTNPELCRVYGFFLNPDGTIITGLTGNALVLTYQEDNTVYAGTEVGTYVTTGTYAGMMYFDLARGASATITLDAINYSKAFTVPELDTEELKDL